MIQCSKSFWCGLITGRTYFIYDYPKPERLSALTKLIAVCVNDVDAIICVANDCPTAQLPVTIYV